MNIDLTNILMKTPLETYIQRIIDAFEFTKPYNASQGEDAYAVFKITSIEAKLIFAFAGLEETFETETAKYLVKESRFRDNEIVLYKFNK